MSIGGAGASSTVDVSGRIVISRRPPRIVACSRFMSIAESSKDAGRMPIESAAMVMYISESGLPSR